MSATPAGGGELGFHFMQNLLSERYICLVKCKKSSDPGPTSTLDVWSVYPDFSMPKQNIQWRNADHVYLKV